MANHYEISALLRRNRRLGLAFGLLMGLCFSALAWGPDALRLNACTSFLPWLKLAIGGACALILAGAVGMLVGHLDHAAAGLIGWAICGASLATLAGHLPYEAYGVAAGMIDPQFQGLDTFPYVMASSTRQTVATLLVSGLFALAGLFETSLLEQARGAPSRLGQALALLTAAPAFLLAGFWADDFVNKPLREPQTALADVLRTVLETPGLTPQERLELHVGALNAIADLVDEPRLMMVNDYDPQYLSSVTVEVEFERGWARCHVIARQLTFCQLSDEMATEAFLCALGEGGGQGNCRGEPSAQTEAWLGQSRPRLGTSPQLEIGGRMGSVTLLNGRAEDGTPFSCRLSGSFPVLIDGCAFEAPA